MNNGFAGIVEDWREDEGMGRVKEHTGRARPAGVQDEKNKGRTTAFHLYTGNFHTRMQDKGELEGMDRRDVFRVVASAANLA